MNTTTNSTAIISLVQDQIDRLGDCTTDGPVVFVNHWNRVCAKVESRRHKVIAGWGDDIDQALNNLATELAKT